MKSFIPHYVEAVCQELKSVSNAASEKLKIGTIFFGGGTPSLLSVPQYKKILEVSRECFDMSAASEITIEANPGTVNREYLQGIR